MEPLDIDHNDGIITYALENNCSRETYDLLLKRLPDSVKKFISYLIR
jgi:hypothetical protein